MSGPVQPPLTVETIDGATVGRPITKIKVTNGTLTVSGNTATIVTGGGGGGGSGTVTSVGLTETGSALTITGSPVTTSGTINIAGAGTSSQVILGNLSLGTLTSGTVTSVGTSQAFITITNPTSTPSISIGNASGAATGVLTASDWTTFNNKGSGTITGSATATQVSYGAATANEITSSSNLTFDGTNLNVAGYVEVGTKVTTPSGTNLELIPGGVSSGSIVIEDGADGQISLNPNGNGVVKIDGVEINNSLIQTGYVLKATSATAAGWAAESGGGGGAPTNAEYVTLASDATLTNERVLAYGQGIGIIDNGANNNVNVQSRLFNAPRTKVAGNRWVVTKMAPYGLGTSQTGTSTSTLYDRPSFYIFTAPATGDIDELGIYLQNGASSTCNGLLGVYTTTDDGWPNELMGYATFDLTTSGSKLSTSFTYRNNFTAIRTNAGESYWLAFVRDATVGFTISVPHTTYSPQMIYATTSSTEIYAHTSISYAN